MKAYLDTPAKAKAYREHLLRAIARTNHEIGQALAWATERRTYRDELQVELARTDAALAEHGVIDLRDDVPSSGVPG